MDVRLAARNRDLAQLVADRRFRNDLYYRLNVFRQQAAWSLELRAATARLLAATDRATEAHQELAPVCASFIEGFDTADLKDAQALVNILAAPPEHRCRKQT